MQKYIIVGVILLALIAGYFILGNKAAEAPQAEVPVVEAEAAEIRGEVVSVDSSGIALDGPYLLTVRDAEGVGHTIAVPSMGINLCAARDAISGLSQVAVGDFVEVRGAQDEEGNIVPCDDASHYLTIMGYAYDETFGFEFTYRKGPDGYVTLEDRESQHSDFVTGLMLINEEEYRILQESTDAREGPPTMNMRVYRNDANLHPPVWAMRNPNETNYNLMIGEPEETVVGGANAIRYTVDGLYPIDTYVVAHGEHVYVLMGAYLERDSQIYVDFQTLVASFNFPEPRSQGAMKIDPRVACESALAYMSFESGEDAEEFVEACVRGEHPEIIERYINDMGFDGATI